jgi:PKD domain
MATPRQFRRRGRFALVTAVLVGALTVAGLAFGAVTTDQPDYAPGSVATISGDNSNGAGYVPGNTVDVTASGGVGWSDSCSATVAGDGTWSCTVTLSSDPAVAVGSYSYTATSTAADGSTISESGTFSDGAPYPTNLTLNGISTPLTPGQTGVAWSGTVSASPAVPDGNTVQLQWGTATDCSNVVTEATTTTTGGNGSFSSTFTAPAAGTYGFMAHFPDTGGSTHWGASSSACQVITVNPAVSLTADAHGPYSGDEGSAISLTGSQTGGVGTIGYHWAVDTTAAISGDTAGDTGIACTFSPSADVASPSVTCNDDSNGGYFTLTLTVKDGNNPSGVTDTAKLTVTNVKPTVTFDTGLATTVDENGTTTHHYTYTISDPGSNDTVTADSITPSCDSTTVVDGDAVSNATNNSTSGSFDCKFPDGEKPATTAQLSVTATDDDGAASDAATLGVTVNNVAPTVNAFTPSQSSCGVTISSVTFSDPGGTYDEPYTGTVNWGDGGGDISLGTVTSPINLGTHHYAAPGPYTITVKVTDADGDTGSNTASLTVLQTYTVNFLQPFDGSSPSHLITNTMKSGRVVPVKLTLYDDCAQAYVTDPNTIVKIYVKANGTGTIGSNDAVETYADAGASNSNTLNFRWTSDSTVAGGGFWIYNLDSKTALGGSAFVIGTNYRIDVLVGSGNVQATANTWALLTPVK